MTISHLITDPFSNETSNQTSDPFAPLSSSLRPINDIHHIDHIDHIDIHHVDSADSISGSPESISPCSHEDQLGSKPDTDHDKNTTQVLSTAYTNPLQPGQTQADETAQQLPQSRSLTHYPDWMLDLVHQLRHFRQWRLIIKPDQTIDVDYLAALALQAQRKARTSPSPAQLPLFNVAPVANPSETTTTAITTTLALNRPHNLEPTGDHASHTLAPFTLLRSNNDETSSASEPNAISLPNDILTIKPAEQLTDYLSRVASTAIEAAISACGSADAAFIRLGSKPPATKKPTLVLAPNPKTSSRS